MLAPGWLAWQEQAKNIREGSAISDILSSLIELQRRFPDDGACAHYLATLRWPNGFRCPRCGHDRAWMLRTKVWTLECAGCGKQTSVTAGTVMHGSKLALTVWF